MSNDSVDTLNLKSSVPGGNDEFVNAKRIYDSVGTLGSSVGPTFNKLQVPDGNHDELAKCALAALRHIEKEGGSAAFEAWLKETDNGRKKRPLPDHVERALASSQPTGFNPRDLYDGVAVNINSEAWEETNNSKKKHPLPWHVEQALASSQKTSSTPHHSLLYCSADFPSSEPIYVAPRNSYDGVAVSIYSGIAYTYISVDVIGQGISGSGGAWGLGFGAMWGLGTLIIPEGHGNIQDWSKQIDFFAITAGAGTVGGAVVGFFTEGGGPGSGQILVAGGGVLGAIGFGGKFKFRG